MRDVLTLLGVIAGVMAGFVIVILGLSVLLLPVARAACAARWEGARQTETTWMAGCRVMSDGVFVPEDAMRLMKEEN